MTFGLFLVRLDVRQDAARHASAMTEITDYLGQLGRSFDHRGRRRTQNDHRPRTAILNNLEFDHADIFPDLPAIERQFHHLVRTIPGEGLVIRPTTEPALQRVIEMGCWTPVQTTGEMIQQLAQDSQKINGVVSVIHSIAEQTNLLALNAAIEAARAASAEPGLSLPSKPSSRPRASRALAWSAAGKAAKPCAPA